MPVVTDISNITNNVIGTIYDELIKALSNAPEQDRDKGKYLSVVLEEIFKNVAWEESFNSPMTIICDEIVTSEILIILHQWLRTKCVDIENINVVLCNHCGVSRWWKQWCSVYHQRSFSITELSLGYSHSMRAHPIKYSLPLIPTAETIQSKKNILFQMKNYTLY